MANMKDSERLDLLKEIGAVAIYVCASQLSGLFRLAASGTRRHAYSISDCIHYQACNKHLPTCHFSNACPSYLPTGGTRVYEERRRDSLKLMRECESKRATIDALVRLRRGWWAPRRYCRRAIIGMHGPI